ncbi:lactate utilization protein C [Spirosoma sp. KUDC1026]|uniref:LutC/YkgG family protein n=1 Tax=Spirosoma sp. KUDC1026 TaxID=2745947 RepID=UPI00159BCD79|nr:LUD domain-containing protein [Spirosoma sp. KUDC1026]QKZ15348.1 LUD domain-containing protein [Spirosoma sp. KUDC1026]
MSSRDQILSRARQNKPDLLPLPEVPTFVDETDDLIDRFQKALAFVGGTQLDLADGMSLSDQIRQTFPDARRITSSLELPGIELVAIDANTEKTVLEQVDLAILAGAFAVAENAAIWLPEANMMNRSLPFITQHLVLVVAKDQLVPNMHVAYQRIDRASLSYGVFIAGPSKTADIEQSLVVGAHGARSLMVVLV